jgi:SAM-dependent methyltransferase
MVTEDLATGVGGEHLARYLFAAHWAIGQNAADVCCGVGYGANLLAASGARAVIGLDISEVAVEEARRRFPACQFAVADLTSPVDLSDFAVRVCFEAIEHISDASALVQNLATDLPARGVAIISTPNGEEGRSGNPHHVHEYTRVELRTLLGEHFRSVRLFFQWRVRDPFDAELSSGAVLRAFVPTSLKHRLKRRDFASKGPAEGGLPPGQAFNYRPLPESYLSVLPPGLRYQPAAYWIAVCTHG